MPVTINATPSAPIIDGLMYNPLLQYVPNRWNVLAMERLRKFRIGNYQPRFYTVPLDVTVAIPAGTTLQGMIKMQPGAELIALNFAMLTAVPASNVSYRMRDPDADYTDLSDGYNFTDGNNKFAVCTSVIPTGSGGVAAAGAGTGLSGMRTCFLSRPYFIKTGNLVVELNNTSITTDIQCQLLLYCMEPFTMDRELAKGVS